MAVTASQVRAIIKTAGFKLNTYAEGYVHGLERAEQEYGEHGVKVQILYILNNVRVRGDAQRLAKKQLTALSKEA